ncbi:type II secretion system protein GspL [Thalassovita aquimarina]|uniref:GspL periplasmic domain-containing protein n=1 Tax=Thalassovita aquimarina TaxID=2785917 RepID=A0ABS5HR89_9RHOB|nr:hypothetical protein [Thalassovita aquimarina]
MTAAAQKSESKAEFVRLGAGVPGARQVALVPGVETPLYSLDLPKGLHGQAREQVARRQLADRIGLRDGSVEMRPFAPGKSGDGWNKVLICDPEALSQWRGLSCRAVLPDYLSLPAAEGIWTVQRDDIDGIPLIMARLGPRDGLSAAPEIALRMLQQALTGARPRAILNLGAALPELAELAAAQDVLVLQSVEELAKKGLPLPQLLAHGELSCDLRTDPMAARARLSRRVLPWRWPVLAGAAAIVMWATAQWIAIDRLDTQTRQITQQTDTLVRQHFVATGPILDTRLQVSRALAQTRAAAQTGRDRGDPLDLTIRAAEVIARTGARTESIRFTENDGLTLILRLPDFAAAETVTAALVAEDLPATLVESRVGDTQTGVRTEIRIAPEVTQ